MNPDYSKQLNAIVELLRHSEPVPAWAVAILSTFAGFILGLIARPISDWMADESHIKELNKLLHWDISANYTALRNFIEEAKAGGEKPELVNRTSSQFQFGSVGTVGIQNAKHLPDIGLAYKEAEILRGMVMEWSAGGTDKNRLKEAEAFCSRVEKAVVNGLLERKLIEKYIPPRYRVTFTSVI